MKKKVLFSLILTVFMLTVSVSAVSDSDASSVPIKNEPIIVSNYTQLVNAIQDAGEGDTISIADTIYIRNAALTTDKQITLVRNPGFTTREMINLQEGSILDGFDIRIAGADTTAIRVTTNTANSDITVQNCNFYGDSTAAFQLFTVSSKSSLSITNCSFINQYGYCFYCLSSTNIELNKCVFRNCYNTIADFRGATVTLNSCIIEDNDATIIMESEGELSINNCQISNNKGKNSYFTSDIRIRGKLSITNEAIKGEGYYSLTTGERIEIPFTENITTETNFAHLDDRQAARAFDPNYNEPEVVIEYVEVEKIIEVEKIVEVEKVVEIEKIVEIPVEIEKIVEVPVELERIVEVPVEVEKIVEIPIEVEKIIEVPVEVIVEKIIEVSSPPEIVTVREYVPVYVTEVVEVEKIVEVEAPKETAELNGVTLVRNDDYLSGYFNALKGKNATRADVAQILYHLAEHDETDVAADYGYTDVPTSAPYAEAVNALSNAGLFNGCGNGLFAPDGAVTKAQVLVVLDRLLGLEPIGGAEEHWSMPYVRVAQACGFVGDITTQELDDAISMVEMQELIDYLFAAVPS